ncbi:MAG: class I SAM-dependent methyltransferase [Bacteroidales bacterium]|nr:class I SAM-dependent methyltransferase [Bacteroidales bacterium]MDD3663811.1 class I SAM-dependent methyltransferase [Bacteroidales bacterium]
MNQCFLCGDKLNECGKEVVDHYATNESFSIVECSGCGMNYTVPRPSERNLPEYYLESKYVSHTSQGRGLFNSLYRFFQFINLQLKLRGIRREGFRTGKMLDIGCGNGSALDFFIKKGWSGVGVEPASLARDYALSRGLIVYPESYLNEALNRDFDLITMWHVLEHVYDIPERMTQIKKLLKPDGLLVLALPNRNSFDAKYYGTYWAAYDVPRHLYHFSKKDIEALADVFEFDLVRVEPMWFDSFYVSLASENYRKSGFLGKIRSLFVGLRSNFNSSNTSSLIYYLRPKNPNFEKC